MQRLKAQMTKHECESHWTRSNGQEDHTCPMYWTLHDLKRKGISDSENKRIGGHKTEAMRQRYNVKTETFTAPN